MTNEVHFQTEDGLVHLLRATSNYKSICGRNRFVGEKLPPQVDDPVTCVQCRPVETVEGPE